MGNGFFCNGCSIGLLVESYIEEVVLGFLFIDGILGFGEMEFECSPCLVGEILVVPLSDITCKYAGIGNVDKSKVDELSWFGGCS